MEYRLLGGSGFKVPALTFGTGTFGGKGEEKLTGIAHHKGKLYATGYTKSNDWKKLRGTTDAFVVRLNAKTLGIDSSTLYRKRKAYGV